MPRGHHADARGRRQRLRRQGALRRQDHRLPAARRRRSCPRRTSSSATSRSTARPAARRSSAAWPASGSASATAARMAVVEGVGDHGCEYMTGGIVVVIGPTGRNFAAGMSGGIAFVLDEAGDFPQRCNLEMVDLEPLREPEDIELVRDLLIQHAGYTGSTVAARHPERLGLGRRRSSSRSCRVDYRRVLGRAAAIGRAVPTVGRTPAMRLERGGGDAWVSRPDFMEIPRETPTRRPDLASGSTTASRSTTRSPRRSSAAQGARCMDCGIPFCHQGCPLGNLIPDWNDLVYRDQWRAAHRPPARHQQLPRVHRQALPGPVRGLVRPGDQQRPGHDQADRGQRSSTGRGTRAGSSRSRPRSGRARRWRSSAPARPGWPPPSSSPAPGTSVTVFERADRIGGLLRYGIPDFKMEKRLLDRRLEQMEAEGVVFQPGVNVGVDITGRRAPRRVRRHLPLRRRDPAARPADPGPRARRASTSPWTTCRSRTSGWPATRSPTTSSSPPRTSTSIIIGGGDTGADCLGTVHRQGCRSVHQFEIVPRPPDSRTPDEPLAAVVERLPRLLGPRGGGRPRVLDQHQAIPRRGRPRDGAGDGPRRDEDRQRPDAVRRDPRHREDLSRPTSSCWRWASSAPRRKGMLEQLGVELDRDGQRQGRRRQADQRRRRSSPPAT